MHYRHTHERSYPAIDGKNRSFRDGNGSPLRQFPGPHKPVFSYHSSSSSATSPDVSAALAEIAGAKTAYELKVNDGVQITKLADIGFNATSSERCTYTVDTFVAATGASVVGISCTLKGSPRIAGKFINLQRTTDGQWKCITSLDSANAQEKQFIPVSCTTDKTNAKAGSIKS